MLSRADMVAVTDFRFLFLDPWTETRNMPTSLSRKPNDLMLTTIDEPGSLQVCHLKATAKFQAKNDLESLILNGRYRARASNPGSSQP